MEISKRLYDFASPRQREYLDAIEEHGTQAAAAKALGITTRTLERGLALLKEKAETTDQTALNLKGKSTLYDGEGNVKAQWVKEDMGAGKDAAMLREFVAGLTDAIRGAGAPAPRTDTTTEDDLLCVYPMGDPHVGMYAWADECGEDFDCEIAERDIEAAMLRLVAQAPRAKTAIILNLGDFFHADNMLNMTARSGNMLDVDTRWARVMRLGARLMIRMVSHALTKHENVIVRNVIGNHDDHSSLALSLIMEAYFEGNKRVHVSTSPSQVWFHRHGKVLIGAHHGHNIPKNRLLGTMVVDAAEHWSHTEFRYWYLGHVHHSEVHEEPGVLIEYFRTLAAKDAYAAGAGYRSGRDMRCITLHKLWGEISRVTMSIQQVRSKS